MSPSLAPIAFSNATISSRHVFSLNNAFQELTEASGIVPRVLNMQESADGISGGSRTLAETFRAGPSGPLSDHYESNALGRAAVDIDNHRAMRNILGSDRFEAILAAHGWRNITLSGEPFPSEPWHFANHDEQPEQPEENNPMKVYERGVNSGVFGLGYPGGWTDIDNDSIPNVRAVLTQAFGAPIQQLPADYDNIKRLVLQTKQTAVAGPDIDELVTAIASKIKLPTVAEIAIAVNTNAAKRLAK